MKIHRFNYIKRGQRSFLLSSYWTRAVAGFAAVVIFCTTYWLMLPAMALTGNEATSESGIFLDASEDTTEAAGDSEQAVTEEEIAEIAEETVAVAEDDGEATITEVFGSWEQIPESELPAVSEETTPGGRESGPADSGSAVPAAASSEVPQTSAVETNSGTVAESDTTGMSVGSSSATEDAVATEESTSTSVDIGTEESLSEETVSEESSVDSEELSAEVEEQGETEEEEEVFGSGKLLFRGKNYSVTIEYNADAKIPDTAELRVRELEEDSEEYQAHYETAKNNVKENGAQVRTARFFDITIVAPEKNADDADAADEEAWREIEPAAPVKVNITFDKEELELPEKTEVEVLHFADENNAEAVEKEKVEVETSERSEGTAVSGVGFDADAFSVFGVVGTTFEKTVLASDGNNYKITVTCGPESGIPWDAELSVTEVTDGSTVNGKTYDEYVAGAEDALGIEEGSAGYIRLFDIKIVDKDDPGVKYQPAEGKTVDVKIELADAEGRNDLNVVHFADSKEEGEKVDTTTEAADAGQTVEFEAEGFSVYAVVGEGSEEDESRVTVNFYGKDTSSPLATVYVKNSDTPEELEEIVYDPGCGELDTANKELFDGWVISTVNTTDGSEYTIETEGKTIEDIRTYLKQMEIKEGDVLNIYAKVVKTITISYIGETAGIVLGSTNLKVLGNETAEHVINMNYTPETAEQAFMGWNVYAGASNIQSATREGEDVEDPYLNGTTLTVSGDVTLSVDAPYGHWLVFDENGKGATYHAPQFIEEGDVTQEPSGEMTRLGYTFGGWYTDQECTDGNEFSFGGELTENTTIYAKWTQASSANYTVIVWKERMTDTYAENGGTGEGKDKNYDFSESYTLTGNVGTIANAVSDGATSVVDGDPGGTPYNNARIRGTRSTGGNVDTTVAYTGYHCAGYDTGVEITPEGNTVINVYYDRNTVTYTFYTYGTSEVEGYWWLCMENGDEIIRSGQNANNRTGIATRNGNNYTQYTGRVAYQDGNTYYYSVSTGCIGSDMREAHWEYHTQTVSQWNVYQEEIGLYGESLNWPTDTSIWWYENHTTTSGTGTRMTYKDAFLPLDNDMTVEYWGNTSSASGTIHFWTQNVEGGDNYTDQVQVATGNANFSINDKFTGFYAYQYRTDNGTWRSVGALDEETGIYGSPVSYNNRLDIRYNRIKADITFLDGSYFDGNGNRLDETPQAEAFHTSPEYYYEADISSYNKDGDDYYTPPEKAGYTFGGWYADDACTVAYDFTTMSATGVTVYAKWVQNQYRVFLHPNVPESDTTLNWGSEDQDMNFRVSSGETVSTPTGTRSEYKLIGWYLDEGCTQVFDAEHYILNDTSVTTLYDQSVNMTDEMNKYGNIVGEGYNSDAQNRRFWISRKLDLYAKWRAELIGAEGIGVKYDANGGSNAPNDTNLYLDNSDTIAQGASTPPDNTQQFLHWVIQTWDDTAGDYVDIPGEDAIVYPGEAFTVLKSNAYIEELEGSTPEDPKYRYTVQLRAEYGPKDEPTPTHIWWFPNNVETERHEAIKADDSLQINEAVTIPAVPTRDGYEFLGWARVPEGTSASRAGEGGSMPTAKVLDDLTEGDLFLTYHKEDDGYYTAIIDGASETVTKVAADERNPYQDLYAVWSKKKYNVTVVKSVIGIPGDDIIPFTFTPVFDGMSGDDYTSAFQLVGNENGADIESDGGTVHYDHSKLFSEIPYDTVFSITEQQNEMFNVIAEYKVENADKESDNGTYNVSNGDIITVKGNITLTVTNTRKIKKLRIKKTDLDGNPLEGASFTVSVAGTEYVLTSNAEGILVNKMFTDGILTVPYGEYSLVETESPTGYIPLTDAVDIVVNERGISVPPSYEIEEPSAVEDFYKLSVPNNPGAVLPNTGGPGTGIMYLLGSILIAFAGGLLLTKRIRYERC